MRGTQTNRRTTTRQIKQTSANSTIFEDRTKDRPKSGNHIDHSRAGGISMLELPYTFLCLMHNFYLFWLRERVMHRGEALCGDSSIQQGFLTKTKRNVGALFLQNLFY